MDQIDVMAAELERLRAKNERLRLLLSQCALGLECAIANANKVGDDSFLGYILTLDVIKLELNHADAGEGEGV